MTTGVKICGVNSDTAFDACVAAGADYVGFVFFARSPRGVSPSQAAFLSARHPGGPKRVGLFVAPTDDEVAAALAATKLDILQLNVPADRAVELRQRFGVPVWRAVGIAARSELPNADGGADALLIEAKPPPGATRPGGNAVTLDWSMLSGWQPSFDWLLAGGLTPANVATAIRLSGAPAVDVSSGVESSPGVKDAALIHAFVEAAHAANS